VDHGQIVMRAPTEEAVDFYLSQGHSEVGYRNWSPEEIPESSAPFYPVAIRVQNGGGLPSDTVRSTEPIEIEIEYELESSVKGLRVGFYLMNTRGEYIATSFDTDDPEKFESMGSREAGRYVSRCVLPADLLNEGRYVLGMNASSYRVKRYFHDEQALTFHVDASGAPGTHWAEQRFGPLRPRLNWSIERE